MLTSHLTRTYLRQSLESQGLRWVDAHWATPTSGTGRSGIRIIAIRSPGSKLTALSRAACGFALSLVLLVLLSEGENVELILLQRAASGAAAAVLAAG